MGDHATAVIGCLPSRLGQLLVAQIGQALPAALAEDPPLLRSVDLG